MPRSYIMGAVKPHVAAAGNLIGNAFGLKTVGGYRATDILGNASDHPKGLALDFMINNIPDGKTTGDRLAAYVEANHAALKVTYIIWNRRIIDFRNNRGWEAYTGTSNPHTDHVHVSFQAVGSNPDLPEEIPSLVNDVSAGPFGILLNNNTWIRVALFIGGAIGIILGLVYLTNSQETATKIVKSQVKF